MCVQKDNNFNEALYKDYQRLFEDYLKKTVKI